MDTTPPPPSPSMVAAQMARDTAQALDFFAQKFGPLPLERIAISPIPGGFGQGWPGLVYLSTLSYLLPFDSARRPMAETTDLFYRALLLQHELAHQWWGHVVVAASYHDEWITEALSSYSALLWLEQQGRSGPHQVRQVLDRYRQDLLVKQDDETAESVGPPVLGVRLNSSKSPNGQQAIYYKKGPWIIHMLRQLMRDPKTGSDAAFFKFLRAVREEFSSRPLDTAGFRALAEKFVSPEMNAENGRTLEWFFDQWVYGTGIPEVKVKTAVEAARGGGRAKLTTTAVLEGVEESWILPLPIYAQTARGEVFAGTAVASVGATPEESKFTFTVAAAAQRALADPQHSLLAVWK